MPLKYIGMLVCLVIVLNLCLLPLGGYLNEEGNPVVSPEVMTDLNTITHFGIVQEEMEGISSYFKYPMMPFNYAAAMYRFSVIVTDENNEIFPGGFRYLWWALTIPITAMVAFGMIATFLGIFRRTIG